MQGVKYYLMGIGGFTLLFGILYLLMPEALAGPAGFANLGASATTDVRATYGGFQIGLGAFLLFAARDESLYAPALLLVALSIGAVLSCRVIGLVIDRELSAFHVQGLVFESGLTVATAWMRRRLATLRVA